MAENVQYQLVRSDGASWTVAEGGRLSIGRSQQNDVQITDSGVSRRHATLLVARGRCWIRDEESMHGAFVNGQRVEGQQEFRPGDSLQIGPTTFRLERVPVAASTRKGPLPERQRRQVMWAVASVAVLIVVISIALSAGGDRDAGPRTITRNVSTRDGAIVELGGEGAVVFLPGALSEDAGVTVRTLSPAEASAVVGDQPALSAVYDVTTEASAVDGEIELQLPYDDTGLSFEEESNLSIFYEEGGRHVALASTVDTEANVVYARTMHLTHFWVQINPFDNPRVVRVWSSPQTLADVQSGLPIQDLTVFAEVEDDNVSVVAIRYSFCTYATIFVSQANMFIEFSEFVYRTGLVVSLEGTALPVLTDFVSESQRRGRGRCYPVSEWVSMSESSSGAHQATILLSQINWGRWEEPKMELAKIKVEVVAEDADEKRAGKSLVVNVVHGPVASDIEDASPSEGRQVFSPRPNFTWDWVDSTSVEAARFYLSKGGVLWRDQGRPEYEIKERPVSRYERGMQWQAKDPDLEVGLYCWGLEVSYDDDVFGEPDDIRTRPSCFYVREEGEEHLDVVVVPSRGRQGEVFDLSVSGLEPNGTAIVGLIGPGSTAEETLSKELPADGRGGATFSIGSSADMEPGVYTVYVITHRGGERVESTFELIASGNDQDDDEEEEEEEEEEVEPEEPSPPERDGSGSKEIRLVGEALSDSPSSSSVFVALGNVSVLDAGSQVPDYARNPRDVAIEGVDKSCLGQRPAGITKGATVEVFGELTGMTAHGGGIYISICGDSSYYVQSSEEDGDQGSWEGDLLPAPNFTAPVEGETIYWDRGPKCDAEQEDVRFFWTDVRPDDLWEDATVKYTVWCFVAHEGEWQGGWQQCAERYHNFCYVSPDSMRELMALDPIDNPNSYAKWQFSCGVVLAKGSTPPLTHISEKSFVQFYIEQPPCPEIQ